ncbi:protein of unknown function [Nitratireductor aquimarinus]
MPVPFQMLPNTHSNQAPVTSEKRYIYCLHTPPAPPMNYRQNETSPRGFHQDYHLEIYYPHNWG